MRVSLGIKPAHWAEPQGHLSACQPVVVTPAGRAEPRGTSGVHLLSECTDKVRCDSSFAPETTAGFNFKMEFFSSTTSLECVARTQIARSGGSDREVRSLSHSHDAFLDCEVPAVKVVPAAAQQVVPKYINVDG